MFLTITAASCTSNPPTQPVMPTIEATSPRPSPTVTVLASATPTFVPTPTSTLITKPVPVILAQNLPSPDDLLLAPDGSIYISDVQDQTVKEYSKDGKLKIVLSGLSEPEGMVKLPDGTLIIAEQGTNRLVRYNPATKALTLFLALRNTTHQDGVDGIAYDAKTQTIIVPDSPNGTALRVGLDGKIVSVLAHGLARPTGAWVEADGSVLVAEENGNTVDRIQADGSLQILAHLETPDDVIEDGPGNIFVNTLGDGAIHMLSAVTNQDTVLISGLIDPQGITFDDEGNLVISDAGHHQLDKLILH